MCLINATALGTEILKGLVLPSIGGFTIVDGAVVTEEDIGCKYLLEFGIIFYIKLTTRFSDQLLLGAKQFGFVSCKVLYAVAERAKSRCQRGLRRRQY